MATVIPRNVICVLGQWSSFDIIGTILRQPEFAGFELDRTYSQLSPDSRMTAAFEASYERVAPSMTAGDWEAIETHTAVAYVLSPRLPLDRAADLSGLTLMLTAALLETGGVAAKGEASGIAHGSSRWLQLSEDFKQAVEQRDIYTAGASLYRAWVRRPLLDQRDGVYYSCGMHLLGQPDVEIERSLPVPNALDWMDLLCLYLAADRPTRPLKDGEGFRLSDDGPRRVLRLRACQRYEADDFLFNPYGYIGLRTEN